jgi:PAS domain S-box-containing protein
MSRPPAPPNDGVDMPPHMAPPPPYQEDVDDDDDATPSATPATTNAHGAAASPAVTAAARLQSRPILRPSPPHSAITPTINEPPQSPDPSASSISPDETEIARLRAAVTARMTSNLQRAKANLVAQQQQLFQPQSETLSPAPARSSTSSQVPRRPSPIKEEHNTVSPLTAAFSSPLATAQTASTESTSSSSRTIRGSAAATPAAMPLRTPSYPFPYVPGTPRTWSSAFHQPFTALSPTVSAAQSGDSSSTPGGAPTSGATTPAATGAAFAPRGFEFGLSQDPRFPTPNVYDLVLQLSSEPGLEAWWSTVANIMNDVYKADRASLALPADSNDIENVPWGQKATFNVSGREDSSNDSQASGQPASLASSMAPRSDPSPWSRIRPTLETRHSYAGHTSVDTPHRPGSALRPNMPSRTVSHAPSLMNPPTPSPGFDYRLPNYRSTSISDPEFSSVGGYSQPAQLAVYPVLKGLESELDGLIDTSGINRVLERGKLITLTRDYSTNGQDSQSSSNSSQDENTVAAQRSTKAKTQQPPPPPPPPQAQSTSKASQTLGNPRTLFSQIDNNKRRGSLFEEYEQYPPSPWAQSPAPSPAMQADPENNPFFIAEDSVEDSFNPSDATHDYSHLEPVEAIGVDRAHTVLHIPLIHPTLSPIMHNYPGESPNPESRPASRAQSVSQVSSGDRRAPIAILSVLSPAVPYPQNLVQSLKLLGPHLATSYYMAHQYTNAHNQAMGVRHRRSISGHNVGFAPLNIAPGNLDDLIRADLDEVAGSISGSMTSPSDYSGRSRHSPSGSIVGTPGWDPAAFGLNSNSRSVVNTPAGLRGSEIIDSYFDAKKMHRTGGAAGNQTSLITPAKDRSKRVSMTTNDEEQLTPKSERRFRQPRSAKEDKSPLKPLGREQSPSRTIENSILRKPSFRSNAAPPTIVADGEDKRHSYLHSYGADFSSSFQGLPAATTPGPKTPGLVTHVRASSVSEDMPPPSERLLRTIIDSLPVQIFTAAPGTGALTWVNSKFLVYRGHDSRQVLKEPWQAIHPEDKSKYMDSWNRSLRTGQQLQQKIRLQRFDGNYRWFYVRAAPLKDKKQNIVHWIGTNMDFHEQHLAEVNLARQQETAASEAKYRALANSSPQVVFTVNKAKGVTFCNSQWLNYSGQSEPQALGIGFMEHVHPDDIVKCRLPAFDNDSNNATNVPTTVPPEPHRTVSSSVQSSSGSSDTERGPTSPMNTSPTTQLPQARLSQLASTGILKASRDADGKPSYSTEVRLRSKDGEYRWHLVRVLLAERDLQNDEEDTWYGTCTDINDHKALERDLKETMDEKSRFLSNMSHEIRTPLNGITGMVNFLIDSSLTSEQMEHVNIIRASTEGLRGLINDILDLSKAEAGMIQLNMDWMHVRSLIEEVNDLTSAMAIDKGLELNYLVEPNVPSQIKGDRFRIRQILLNVIGNAIKFTQTGEVFVRCSLPLEEEYQPIDDSMYVQFEIMDTGQGFTEKEAQYLFKRFSQIDGSSTRQHGGTGLGLVISRQLAQLHGGDMSARGVPGKGATFAFVIKTTLPAGDDKPPPPPATPGPALLPLTPILPSPAPTITQDPRVSNTLNLPYRSSPKLLSDASDASSPDFDRVSPITSSSGSSDPSIMGGTVGSGQSVRSSASSYVPDPSLMSMSPPMELAIPTDAKSHLALSDANLASSTIRMVTPGGSHLPPMYSILVVCPLEHARKATVEHMDMTLPKNIPHKITARGSLIECQKMIGGDDPMIFSHIVLVLQSVSEIIAFVQQVFGSAPHSLTQIVLISDLQQRRKLMEQAPQFDHDALSKERKLQFIFKPLKPSKFAAIFDPRKEREMSTDRNQDSAQQVAVSQKQVYEEMIRRLGNKNKRVLLVEDNRVNQMVSATHADMLRTWLTGCRFFSSSSARLT